MKNSLSRRKTPLLPPVHTGDELNLDDCYVEFKQTMPTVRFRHWIRTVGLRNLSRALAIHRTTVNAWLVQTSRRRVPAVDTAQRIIALSRFYPKPSGAQGSLEHALRYEDIFGRVEAKEVK